ncbi:MAG: chalcone isomerase family protein [Bdellovibrionales bacterium]|nr:chalcone isomerase family protein [Bdellovibrionales bacterium]
MKLLKFGILGCLTLMGLSLGGVSQAGVLQLDGQIREIEGVTISKGAEAQLGSNRYALTTVGAGLRKKKVGLFSVKVYVAQILVSDPAKFVHNLDQALASLDGMRAVALRMNFLRDVEVEKIRASYQESLLRNGIDISKPEVRTFLEAVEDGGPATTKRDMIVAGHRLPDRSEQIVYENSADQSVSINGTSGFVKSIFSIWLGQTTDSELEALRTLLITGY